VNLEYPHRVLWTLGTSYDDLEIGRFDKERANPKLGVQWEVAESIRLRAAYFQTLKRRLIVEQSLEPTQVAGFTQFFDDTNGTDATRYGLGLDARPTRSLLLGMEASRRDLSVPQFIGDRVDLQNRDEDLLRGYAYWAPKPRCVV